jgi:hypothetical protein
MDRSGRYFDDLFRAARAGEGGSGYKFTVRAEED